MYRHYSVKDYEKLIQELKKYRESKEQGYLRSRMPLEGPQELAGAFKSKEATTLP